MALAGTASGLLASTTSTVADVSAGHLLLQMVIAIGVIGGGIWLFGKFVQRRRNGTLLTGGKSAVRGLSVVSRTSLGKDHLIAVVAWGDRELLVGVSGATITLLAEGGERGALTSEEAEQYESAFAAIERPSTSIGQRSGSGRPGFLDALRAATLRS